MLRIVLSFIFCVISSLAIAQNGAPPPLVVEKMMSLQDIAILTGAVRDRVHQIACVTGRGCAPERADERARPLVPRDVELRVIDTGMISGTAEWCGIRSTRHFLAMMNFERGCGRRNDRQITYIGALHGSAQGHVMRGGRGTTCTEAIRADMTALLDKRIGQYRAATPR